VCQSIANDDTDAKAETRLKGLAEEEKLVVTIGFPIEGIDPAGVVLWFHPPATTIYTTTCTALHLYGVLSQPARLPHILLTELEELPGAALFLLSKSFRFRPRSALFIGGPSGAALELGDHMPTSAECAAPIEFVKQMKVFKKNARARVFKQIYRAGKHRRRWVSRA
jgi:hypothetical protein